MLTLLIGLIVVLVLIWAARAILAATNTPEPFATIVLVVIVLIALLWLAGQLGVALPSLK